jgi:Protein of unknown function (DUF1176)
MKYLLALMFLSSAAFADAGPFDGIPAPVMAFHKAVNGVNCDYSTDSFGETSQAADVGHGWKLYLVVCNQGAYQAGYKAYFAKAADNSQITQMYFVDWAAKIGVFATSDVMEAQYENGKIYTHGKDRGIGDCGSSAIYQVVADDYFVNTKVLEIRSKDKCDGRMDPWPRVFPK